ncbi:MAG: PspC domain-containing protein [Candidatus Micrarchaeia archaeon]|jgi:phage shock protein PspC (stress-responsive transcriptional regulator)
MAKSQSSPKRLYRSKSERILGGVCGGIAGYFNVDPTIVRLLWVGLTLLPPFTPAMIVLYILMWIIVPRK